MISTVKFPIYITLLLPDQLSGHMFDFDGKQLLSISGPFRREKRKPFIFHMLRKMRQQSAYMLNLVLKRSV